MKRMPKELKKYCEDEIIPIEVILAENKKMQKHLIHNIHYIDYDTGDRISFARNDCPDLLPFCYSVNFDSHLVFIKK